MLSETGRVVAIDDGCVWVETLRHTTCGSCAARAGCGHGVINTAAAGASRGLLRVLVSETQVRNIQLHDTVQIALPERGFLRAAWMLYAMPLLCTIAAALAAQYFLVSDELGQGAADLRVTAAAAAGLGLGLVLLRAASRRRANDQVFQPRITAVC